jgi:hypothetical protein
MSAQDGLCLCGDGIPVFGTGNCPDDLGAPETLLISLLEDSNGDRIGLDYSVPLDAAYMNGIFHNENPNDAMTIIRGIERFTPEQADDVTEESSKGTISKVRDGVTTYEYEFWSDNVNVDANKWEAMSCLKIQLNVIDTNKNYQGKRGAGTTIIGKEIVPNSLSVRPSPNTFEGRSKLIIKFSLDLNSGEKTGVFLSQSDFTNFDLHDDVIQLRNVNCTITSNTLTTVSFKLSLDHGSLANPKIGGCTGLTTGDLQLRNQTDEADVVFSGLVEPTAPDGSYVGTFAAQDALDVVNIDPILNVKLPLRLNNITSSTSILSA